MLSIPVILVRLFGRISALTKGICLKEKKKRNGEKEKQKKKPTAEKVYFILNLHRYFNLWCI